MRIAVVTKNRSNPAFAAARMGADRAAARLGDSTTHYMPLQPDDPVEQARLIDAALAGAPDAVVIAPVSDARVDAAIARLHAAGIPVAGFVNRSAAAPLVSFIGADDGGLATEIAEYLLEHLRHRGNVLLVEGPAGSPTSDARTRGFLDALQRYQGVRIAARCSGGYQRDMAREAVDRALLTTPSVDGVLCANDVMALGALESLRRHGRKARVVGVNAIPEAIEAIGRGDLLATVDFNAMWMCALATECAIWHLRGERVPASLRLPVQIVDGSNYRQWKLPYEQRPLPTLHETLTRLRPQR